MPENDKVLIISHNFLTGPDGDLVLYLNNNKYADIVHITHSFSDSPNRKSECKWYKQGLLYDDWQSKDYINYPDVLIYIKEILFTISSVLHTKLIWDRCVCMDGLCTVFGITLRNFRKVKKVNYWAMDFVPENRFTSNLKNFFYHSINKFGYRNADEMWDLSPRMERAREKFLGIESKVYKDHKVVPYGVWLDRIRRYSYEECEKATLVFMGHLIEKQGVQLVIKAIPEIIKKIPDFKFKIIGTGSYENELKRMVEELRIGKNVKFFGKIEKPEDLENEIAKSCVAIAPYIEKLDTWTKYADPGKVKTYLACGVPVLLTNVPWNATQIEERNCGRIISENINILVENIVYLFNKNTNQIFRDNAINYATGYDYGSIFGELDL